MSRQCWNQTEADALKAAFAQDAQPDARGAGRIAALSPHITAAAFALRERRRTARQAWALAGSTVAFLGLAVLGYLNREFLAAEPQRWVPLVVFGAVALIVTGCMPLFLKTREEN